MEVLPSPCGDKLKSIYYVISSKIYEFPSPYGDKLKSDETLGTYQTDIFPSPCGDKLKSGQPPPLAGLSDFRPLAGIS